ncbi:hypothetical protein KR200_001733, partial [Drosophila serrata]
KMCDNVNILILGDIGVGKTSLLWRLLENSFYRSYERTILIDIEVQRVEVNGASLVFVLWDTSGIKRHHDTIRNFYCDAHGVIIVYDITSLNSFFNVSYWLKQVRNFCPKDVEIVLVGNKCDERYRRQVSRWRAARFAERHDLFFTEASAKSGAKVRDIFGTLAM